jgi:TPR repeat protein/nucleoid-associated protein YgaU
MPPPIASVRRLPGGPVSRGLLLAALLAVGAGGPLRATPAELKALQTRAEHGDAEALAALGAAYADGRDLPVDYRKAFDYFRQAAAAGSALAEYNLGLMEEAGRGTVPNLTGAFSHYLRAAQQGLAPAEFNVGNMYASGRGVRPDPFEAVLWLRQAAMNHLPEAQYNLALAYEFGRGIGQDEAEAQKWYLAAAVQGYAPARYNLALMLADGRGSPSDPAAAAELLRVAGLQGFTAAQNDYGVALASGRGFAAPDLVAAYAWLALAAENGTSPHNRDVVGRKLTAAQRTQAAIQLGALRAEAGQALAASHAAPAAVTAGGETPLAVPVGPVDEEPLAFVRADPEKNRAGNVGSLAALPADTWLGPAPALAPSPVPGQGALFSASDLAALRAARAKIVVLESGLASLRSEVAGWQRMADESGRLAAQQADEKKALEERLAADGEAAADQAKKLAALTAEKEKLVADAAALARQGTEGLSAAQELKAADEKLQDEVRELTAAKAALADQLQTLRADNARLAALPSQLEAAESRAQAAQKGAEASEGRARELAQSGAALTSQLAALKAENQRLTDSLQQRETAQNDAQAARKEAEQARTDLASAEARLAEQEKAGTGELEAANAALATQLAAAEGRARAARRDADQAQADLLAVQARLAGNQMAAAPVPPTPRPAGFLSKPSSPASVAPVPAPPRVYVVQDGDSLSRISLKLYGTRSRWQDIFAANRELLATEKSLQPGQELKIPVCWFRRRRPGDRSSWVRRGGP